VRSCLLDFSVLLGSQALESPLELRASPPLRLELLLHRRWLTDTTSACAQHIGHVLL